jgi:hypothetical protein
MRAEISGPRWSMTKHLPENRMAIGDVFQRKKASLFPVIIRSSDCSEVLCNGLRSGDKRF